MESDSHLSSERRLIMVLSVGETLLFAYISSLNARLNDDEATYKEVFDLNAVALIDVILSFV